MHKIALPEHRFVARLDRGAVKRRVATCAIAALVLAASFAYAPWLHAGPVLCPLRLTLGIPCPSCGLTRSFCAVSHGAFAAAFGYHLLGPWLYAATVLVIPWSLV